MEKASAGEYIGAADPMAEMKKLGAPGEAHKRLEMFTGDWTHKATWRMSATDTPVESEGTNSARWILGGRFIQQEYRGMWMGQEFEGLGLIGYDNIRREYTSVWMDNMSTGMMIATAQYDADANAFNESGTFSCPMTGEAHTKYRAVWTVIDPDLYMYDMYTAGADGEEYKAMEIVYERKK